MLKNVTIIDEGESIFFEQELLKVIARTIKKDFPALKARTILPVNMEADPGHETIGYDVYTQTGVAKWVADYAKDFPRVDLMAERFTVPIKTEGVSFGYSDKEIKKAALTGKPLQSMKAEIARETLLRLENTAALVGDASVGLVGFLNHPNMPEYSVVADGTGASKLWSTKTPDQIIRDLNGLANSVQTQTKGIEYADTVLLPLDLYTYIASTPRSSNSDTTILQYFLTNNPTVRNVAWLNELATLGDGGTRRMIAYRRDSSRVELPIALDFEQKPPQEEGMELVIYCQSMVGGVLFYKPFSAAYGDGI